MHTDSSTTASHAKIDWPTLVKLEPRLADLATDIAAGAVPQRMPFYWSAWSRWKAKLVPLVGWESNHPNPVVRTDAAYDLAYDVCLHAYESAAVRTMEDGDQ